MEGKQAGFFIPIIGVIIIILIVGAGLYYLNSKRTISTTSTPVSNSGNFNSDLKGSLQKAFK
ncbi:hypothetical protein HYU95_00380 [Candidatus Daviesbacteria bacterium]|nr:hypothetical protein [Candidatus Daviesbacteria bacterium]